MGQYQIIDPAFVIKAEELSALNYLNPDHTQPLYFYWINRGTDQKLRRTTIDLLLRTIFQDGNSPSVARLQLSSGLRLVFRSIQERDSFAAAFAAARTQEGFREGYLLSAIFDDRECAELAVAELKSASIPESAISLLWRAGQFINPDNLKREGHSKLSVAAAAAGGGIAGTILGAAVLAIPGIGPIAAAGAIAASAQASLAAVSAVFGATGGAIARMLTDHDVDGKDVNYFERQIHLGRVFVSIDTRLLGDHNEVVRQVLRRNGGRASRA